MAEPEGVAPDFDEPHLARAVERLSPEQVHTLPYGAIRLNAAGQAVFYSDAERRLSGCRKEVLGRNFFVEIAPCMNNQGFRGRIDNAMKSGTLDIAFNYVAEMPSATTDVDARVQSASDGGYWIFLRRSESIPHTA